MNTEWAVNLNGLIVVMVNGGVHEKMDNFFNEVDEKEAEASEDFRKGFVNQDLVSGLTQVLFNLAKNHNLDIQFLCARCIFPWNLEGVALFFLRRF